MTLNSIDASIEINASRERVWRVLTDPGLVEQWLGCLNYSGAIGDVFYMQPDPGKRDAGDVSDATHCELELLEPPERMRFSWYMPGMPKTHVTMELSDQGRLTRVRLIHSGWEQFEPEMIREIRDMLQGGWTSFVLPGLKRVAEA